MNPKEAFEIVRTSNKYWKEVRNAKTGPEQARIVWEASGLLDANSDGILPNGRKGCRRVPCLEGFEDAFQNQAFPVEPVSKEDLKGYLYFSVEFLFDLADPRKSSGGGGVHINWSRNEQKDNDELIEYMKLAERKLLRAKIDHVHCYAYPGDGNFYKYVRVPASDYRDDYRGDPEKLLQETLAVLLADDGLRVRVRSTTILDLEGGNAVLQRFEREYPPRIR